MGNQHLIPVDLWKMVCEWNPSESSNPRSKGAEALFFNSQPSLSLISQGIDSLALQANPDHLQNALR